MENEHTKRNWFYTLSPCIIAAAFSLFVIIYSIVRIKLSGGWSYLGIVSFVPFLLIFLIIDAIIKGVFKLEVRFIWIIEIIIISITALVILHYIPG